MKMPQPLRNYHQKYHKRCILGEANFASRHSLSHYIIIMCREPLTRKNGSFHLQCGSGIAEKYLKQAMQGGGGTRNKTFNSYSLLLQYIKI
jgi:hypothetical protein